MIKDILDEKVKKGVGQPQVGHLTLLNSQQQVLYMDCSYDHEISGKNNIWCLNNRNSYSAGFWSIVDYLATEKNAKSVIDVVMLLFETAFSPRPLVRRITLRAQRIHRMIKIVLSIGEESDEVNDAAVDYGDMSPLEGDADEASRTDEATIYHTDNST